MGRKRSIVEGPRNVSREKTADSIELAFGTWTRGGPRNRVHVLDGDPDLPHEKGNLEGGGGSARFRFLELL